MDNDDNVWTIAADGTETFNNIAVNPINDTKIVIESITVGQNTFNQKTTSTLLSDYTLMTIENDSTGNYVL